MRFQDAEGKLYGTDAIVEVNGIRYKLRNQSPEKLASIGFSIYEEPPPVDSRFYFGPDAPRPIEMIQEAFISQIKAEASGIILEAFPLWKQSNMIARGVELQDIWRKEGKWSETEQAEADALQAAWDWIKAVRSHSDDLENEVLGLTFEELKEWRTHDWPSNPNQKS